MDVADDPVCGRIGTYFSSNVGLEIIEPVLMIRVSVRVGNNEEGTGTFGAD